MGFTNVQDFSVLWGFSVGFWVVFVLSVCFSCTLLRVCFGAWSFLTGKIKVVFAWFSVSTTLS